MKFKFYILTTLLLLCNICVGAQRPIFVEGEVLVKFRSNSKAAIKSRNGVVSADRVGLNNVLSKLGVHDTERLDVIDSSPASAGGYAKGKETQDASGLYLLRYSNDSVSVGGAVSMLKELDGKVEYAEPNYILRTMDVDGYDDPLYNEQWGQVAVNLPQLLCRPTINGKRPVIAILDTGVDVNHPDLVDNIWTNPNTWEGGVHGWDFINDCPAERDNNGHGTHCAGIAAAVGDNGLGIVGANPNALIMPVTVMQSNGMGDVATIIRGIKYAVARNADVLSMSIGTGYYSKAMEEALMEASAKCYIVAAAGNDGAEITRKPCFPAALPFVIGVMASDEIGGRASFSNFDKDGPLSSVSEGMYNYEVMAPGTNILSTFPNGQYKMLQGTSMACPLVAGAISALIQRKEYVNNISYLMRDLIGSSNSVVDFDRAYTIKDSDFKPSLQIAGIKIEDEDGDNRMDAGETVCIYPIVRNMSGKASGIVSSITLKGEEDKKWITVIEDNANFEYLLDSYGSATSKNPIKIKISEDCPDNTEVEFYINVVCPEASSVQKYLAYDVESGVEIGGSLTEDLTLHPGVSYILTSHLGVPEGITLTMEPGSVLKMKPGKHITCMGTFNAIGTKEHPIYITSADLDREELDSEHIATRLNLNNATIKYVTFENLYCDPLLNGYSGFNIDAEYCTIRNCSGGQVFGVVHFKHSSIHNNEIIGFHGNSTWRRSSAYNGLDKNGDLIGLEYSNYVNNLAPGQVDALLHVNCFNNAEAVSFNFATGKYDTFVDVDVKNSSWDPKILPLQHVYMGTSLVEKAKQRINDIDNCLVEQSLNKTDLTNLLLKPDAEAPGIVWKVLVDGFDPYDEAERIPAIGIGKHKVDVYFNKSMLSDSIPTVTMGIRSPYNDVLVNEEGSWNSDNSVYTAYFTLVGDEDIDGPNTIHVSGAMDNDGFEVPVEEKRFKVVVQASGALETGLVAEVGLACVKLKWETTEDTKGDVMGYNLYRYEVDSEGRLDTLLLNSPVIDASVSEYIDDNVIVGKTYYYYIREISTDLKESYTSNVVAATPKTANIGDANASGSVDVADVVTEVEYIIGGNPQPFIFDAADVTSDNAINVLDVISTVNIIMNPQNLSVASQEDVAVITVDDGILYVDCPIALGGIQVQVETDRSSEPVVLSIFEGMEVATSWIDDANYMLIAYSMSGKSIPAGKHAILNVGDGRIKNVVLSNTAGKNVEVIDGLQTAIDKIENKLPDLGSNDNVYIEVIDILGRVVPVSAMNKGIYVIRMIVNGKVVASYKIYKQ